MKKFSGKLLEINKERNPGMVYLKFRFMHENLYRFFRGTNYFFYRDLAASGKFINSPAAWICGDLHLENFGSYKSSNQVVYFDLNDFDDACLAPVAWEPVRMVTSIFIAFDSLRIGHEKATRMAKLFLKSYTETLISGKADFIEEKTATGIVCDFLKMVSLRKQKTILQKRTEKKKRLSTAHPKHLALDKTLQAQLNSHIENWLHEDGNSPYNYKVIDSVFRIAGTSSIGLERYAVLLKSSNDAGEKYLLLDMKESAPSPLDAFVKNKQPKWETNAQRILFVQYVMQNRIPTLLSSTVFNGKSFVIQEMQSTKDNIDFKLIRKEYRAMCEVISSMGMLAASAQLRSSGRSGSATADALIRFGKDTEIQEEMLQYAIKYAPVIKKYYAEFRSDYAKGVFRKK